MKRVVLAIIPALICGAMFWVASSCNKENNANSALNIKAVVWVEAANNIAETDLKNETLLIEWFNATTREIKFKSAVNGDFFMSVSGGLVSLIVCLDKTELFTLDAVSSISSFSLNHPILIHSGGERGYFIGRGYPDWEYWTEKFWTETNWDKNADWVTEREKNWKEIELGWNKFVAQLKKEGKYRK